MISFSKKPQEHAGHEKVVLTLLKDACVVLKLKKGVFFTNRIDYIGQIINLGDSK